MKIKIKCLTSTLLCIFKKMKIFLLYFQAKQDDDYILLLFRLRIVELL